MARSGLLAGTVITWAKAMGEFGAVLLVAGATTMRTATLPIALYHINRRPGHGGCSSDDPDSYFTHYLVCNRDRQS
jgi:ABC-type sulfate transport system permease subunit